MLLTTHPLLVPQSLKSRAIPLPTLWATTRPVTGTLYLTFIMHLIARSARNYLEYHAHNTNLCVHHLEYHGHDSKICAYLTLSTGHFIMFSVITNIYNKKTKGPTLMELFIATEKLKKFFLTIRDL
jgi:hypothetical protein